MQPISFLFNHQKMFRKLNFQYIFSYLGLIPFILIIFHKYFFFQINEEILKNFSNLLYNIIISVYWCYKLEFNKNIDNLNCNLWFFAKFIFCNFNYFNL